jgi:hypothetical protein
MDIPKYVVIIILTLSTIQSGTIIHRAVTEKYFKTKKVLNISYGDKEAQKYFVITEKIKQSQDRILKVLKK